MSDPFTIRGATPADATILAAQRAAMFADMGTIPPTAKAALIQASAEYFGAALASGDYVGWLASSREAPQHAIGGAGLQLRPMLPRPDAAGTGLLLGREGIIMNVYVERPWRRRGLARRLMTDVLAWARANRVARVVLHASDEGRPLYEALGFVATNEMRYTGSLVPPGPAAGA